MFCANCGKETEDTIVFCPYCGEKQNNNIRSNETENIEWFYIKENTRIGPCNINSIILEINNGNINRDTLVWQQGMQKWISAGLTALSQYLNRVVPSTPDEVVDNKYVWALATVPLLVSWFLDSMLVIPSYTLDIIIMLNLVFIMLDISVLRKAKKNISRWLWLGAMLVPLYLFIRAWKTDKKYAYGITWCLMFAINLLL